MPISFPFRRRKAPKHPGSNREQLRSELDDAIEKLVQFSSVLRQELEVANDEETRINPPDIGSQE